MNDRLPRVLIPSINVWQDTGSVRTLPEIFSCWDKEQVAQIYTKAGLPDTCVCDKFFRINENAVIKSIFKRKIQTSSVVHNTHDAYSEAEQQEIDSQKKRYSSASKKQSWLMSLCRELVWLVGKWKTPELDRFVDEFDPEILFVPVYPVVYMSRLQLHIIKRTNKPVVCYLSDDNYSYKACGMNPLAYIHRFWLRRGVRKIMKHCDRLFVIAPKQKEEYDRIFGTDSVLLTRSIDYDKITRDEHEVHTPLQMIYTGKLGIGRDITIARVAQAVEAINSQGERIRFNVYSGDTPRSELSEQLSRGGNHFCGSVTSDKIEKLQRESDITLFAESLNKKYRNAARLSFSTKLTDYFGSGRCVFAVGSEDIAPMDYLIREDAAITVTDYAQIEGKLRHLCDNPRIVKEYGKKAFECGRRNHNKEQVLSNFREVMLQLAKD